MSKVIKSEKKGSNLICRVSNVTPEMVQRYVQRLPKTILKESKFRELMGAKWFQNEHQAPEQWGLYYIDGTNYYPRFNRDITIKEAERYIYGWIKRLIVINPYTRFKTMNDSRLVESIVRQLEQNPDEHDLKSIVAKLIDGDEPFIINEIIVNVLNKYSEILHIKTINKDEEKFEVYLYENYKEILKTKYNMTKKEYFDSFNDINISASQPLPLQQIFYGAPGTGKSHETNETTRKYPDTIRTTFHPDSDYSTFVGAYKPTTTREFVYGLNGGNTIAFIDPNTNKPLETSKIEYKFVKQAFLKAYIRAWQKMGAADVTTNPLQPSATPAKPLTFTKGLATYTILTMDDSCVSFKKEEPFGKSPVENTWHKLWSSGSFEIPNVPRSGATFQEAVSQWICDWKGADTTKNDFEQGWNEIISRLKAGQQIKVKNNNGNKEYFLSYNGNDDSVKKTSEDNATKNAIENAYNGDTSQNASAKGIADILHNYSSDFKEAWEQLKTVLLNGGQQTTNPAETIAIQPQFLIIEEINRGNCAQIFGDIFQLLDRTDNGYSQYPIEADEDIQKALLDPAPADGLSFGSNGLQLSDAIKQQLKALNDNCPDEIVSKVCSGQLLVLPPNLHIWATMNTSDQSLFPIDSAFKRRWDWQYKPIQDAGKNWKILVENSQYDWWQFIDAINQQINITTSSEDKKLGYFFCKPCEGTTIKADKVVNKVIFYLWNDVFKDYDLPAAFNYGDSKKKSDGSTSEHMSFNDFYTDQAACIHQLMKNLNVIDENATTTPTATPETASDTTTTEVE